VAPIALKPACPACLSQRSRAAFKVGGLQLLRCQDCRSLFLAEKPDPAELEAFYEGAHYFANRDHPERDLGYWDYFADRSEIEDKFAHVLARLEAIVNPGTLVDVGAGPGLLVAVANRRGWNARGVDLNEWAARFAQDELGVRVDIGSLENAALDARSVDAVTMLDLLEHTANPDRLLTEAARITRPGGALAILTPDAGSPTTRVLGKRWPEAQRAPEHTVLYSVRGLGAMVQRHGFTPLIWHWIGKRTTVGTLVGDLSLLAPAAARRLSAALDGRRIAERSVTVDPRAKFCLYARRVESGAEGPASNEVRAPRVTRIRNWRSSALTGGAPVAA
jgi:SAM-dependent methyltransferase